MQNKVILIIMDGWGLGKVATSDAIQNADTPFVDSLYHKYPHTTLVTCGEAVGLPDGQMGNSEVGHLNLGAGRIVYQELQRINVAIRDGLFAKNSELIATIQYAIKHGKPLHLMGLVSNGGIHSHINHLKAVLQVCKANGLKEIYVHAFTDGRDTDPKSGIEFLKDLQNTLDETGGNIATVTGRYYAMDRDKRWERIKQAFDAMVHGIGQPTHNIFESVQKSYDDGITDEFIKPIINTGLDASRSLIKEGDAVICFNFRTDRCREIVKVLTQTDMPEFDMHALNLYFTTMTEYDKTFEKINIIFENDDLHNTLGEVISKAGLKQIRIAETEKYPHVSFFFSGGRENPFPGESRIMVPSPKVATYDLKPEMSAFEITDKLIPEIENETAEFICLNYANADMVGHTGVWEAGIKAVETVDKCVKRIVNTALDHGYTILLTADHGNADYMINENGTPNTAHTKNLVPLFLISNHFKGKIIPGKLGDIAPTILKLMHLPIPEEMTGNILIEEAKKN